jgi:molybdate transport system ATP-binding protein
MREIIKIDNGVSRMPEWQLRKPVTFSLLEGEHIAIIGENGSGKTKLVDMITGRHPVFPDQATYNFPDSSKKLISDNIKYITFRDSYGSYDSSYYLQQRWNQQEINEKTPTAGMLLEEAFAYSGADTEERRMFQKRLYKLFCMDHLLDKYIILLSSGEMRKFQLAKMLLSEPKILIIDNPFIGLDKETRGQLENLLGTLSEEKKLQIVLVLTKRNDIPKFITHVWEMRDEELLPKTERQIYVQNHSINNVLDEERENAIASLPPKTNEYNTEKIAELKNVSIRYGKRTILKDLNWTVLNGENWALSGKNGAGKSTLLSLICADNPQSYACDITLFDKKRGTGESIWDIKKHIGYVSPEMHRAYNKDIECIKIVASGLSDSIGLYVKPSKRDYDTCRFWMRMFGVEDLQNRTFLKISSGEQRLILLARAFVKDPELLILDEPLHGLDAKNGQMVKEIINAFCKRKNKTLIMVSHYREEYPSCINKEISLTRNI